MSRAVALIDGEHYPPVVRAALADLALDHEVLAAVFIGGTEKIDAAAGPAAYGVPLVLGVSAREALASAIVQYAPELVVDLSDEPVLSAAGRFRLAGLALLHGASYLGADFRFDPPKVAYTPRTPTLSVIGTGKRVGKTAISAHLARHLKAAGVDVGVLAMGRGGPDEPEVIHGEQVALTTEDLIALARQGKHASSDNYEDAVMSRVTTIGSRRCGGGMAGGISFGNVAEGARVADGLGKELLVLEGSGAAIPPVHADSTLLVVGASQGAGYVSDYFGPYRVARADAAVIVASEASVSGDVREAISALRPELPVTVVTLRPEPIEPVEGRRVFFATTAPAALLPDLARHLEVEHRCHVVASSSHLSDAARLRADLSSAAGSFDLLLTELKAAAIDVVAMAGEAAGVPTVLCDNVPVVLDGADIAEQFDRLAQLARQRGAARQGE